MLPELIFYDRFVNLLLILFDQFTGGLRIVHLDFFGAPHGHGLDVLGSHNCAQATPAGKAVIIYSDTRNRHPAFSGRTDSSNTEFLVPRLFVNCINRFKGTLAPQTRGVFDPDIIIHNLNINGFFGHSLQNNRIIARIL